MSIPTAVFIDTSIFDGQSYNFSSTALSTFVPACQKRKLKLLLPDPTEREIRRHLNQLSNDAAALLDKARRTAPFLLNSKVFAPTVHVHTLSLTAALEWRRFLTQFDVVRLDYESVAMKVVMNWYDSSVPPFGPGAKRKDFPDALAVAMLEAYAAQNACYIAVVSSDTDMRKACDRFPSLMYFHSGRT